jgi:RNase P subunit RPR2
MTLVFQAIYALKRASNPSAMPPSMAWFGKWWKENRLHKIKSQPLAALRIVAQDENEIQLWFRGYIRTIDRLQIQRRNILNFDETGFRIGCPKGQTLLVPEDVTEVRISSLIIELPY